MPGMMLLWHECMPGYLGKTTGMGMKEAGLPGKAAPSLGSLLRLLL